MMRFLVVLLIAFVPIIAEGQTQECLDVTPSTTPSDHGSFVEGSKDSLQAVDNASALNAAVSSVGDGGVVCLPEGTYYLLPDTNPEGGTNTIEVGRDSVTIWGAGRDLTTLRTRSFADSADTDSDNNLEYWRANGLRILPGNSSPSNPYEDIIFRGFALDGRGRDDSFSGHTGKYGFGKEKIDNWDTSHKGLHIGSNSTYLGFLRIQDVAVRHFRGEQIYQGGPNTDTVVVKNSVSEITNAQAWNVNGDSVLVENSRFGGEDGKTHLWGELAMLNNSKFIFRNNTFKNATSNWGFSMAGGDSTSVETIFRENDIYGSPNQSRCSLIGTGVGPRGPVKVIDNTFENCGLYRGIYAPGSGTTNDWVSNFVFENNDIRASSVLVNWSTYSTIDFVVRKNDITFTEPANIFSVTAGNNRRTAIIDNTISTEGGPTKGPAHPGGGNAKRPLMRGNIFKSGYKLDNPHSKSDLDGGPEPNIRSLGRKMELDVKQTDSVAFRGGSHKGQVMKMVVVGDNTKEARFFADPKPGSWDGNYIVDSDFVVSPPDTLHWRYDGDDYRPARRPALNRLGKKGTGTVTGDTLTGEGTFSGSQDNGHLRSMKVDTTQVATDTMGVEGYLNVQDGPQPFSMSKLRLAKGDSTDSERAAVECSRVGYCRLSIRKNGTLTKYNWQQIPKDTYMRIRTDGQYVWAEHDADEDGVMEILEINNNGTTSKTDDRVALDLGSTPHAGVGCVSGQSGVEATCRARNTTVASY